MIDFYSLRSNLNVLKEGNPVIQSINSLSQQGLELGGDGLQGVFLRHKVSVRTAQMAHQHDGFGPVIQAVFDAGNGRLDPKNLIQKQIQQSLHLLSNQLNMMVVLFVKGQKFI